MRARLYSSDSSDSSDSGATIVEFVGGVVLVAFLLLALAQVATYAYAVNVARHAAHEGARSGAELGREESTGANVASALLRDGLGGTGRSFRVRSLHAAGLSVVELAGEAPRVLPFVPRLAVSASSSVLLEGQ